ncbi:hypothetical protein GCM10009854_06110 [Saccharopolyspora halophila]|uniref:Uncharacterized protein n=1 Tax=Saccharopolyspora halophila TaxID=405551 RepID=A0ABN3FMU1_9PSEU
MTTHDPNQRYVYIGADATRDIRSRVKPLGTVLLLLSLITAALIVGLAAGLMSSAGMTAIFPLMLGGISVFFAFLTTLTLTMVGRTARADGWFNTVEVWQLRRMRIVFTSSILVLTLLAELLLAAVVATADRATPVPAFTYFLLLAVPVVLALVATRRGNRAVRTSE